MKRSKFFALGFAGLLLISCAGSLGATITCTTADYNGTWAFFTEGNFVTLPPAGAALVGPFAQSGTFTGDGQGNVVIASYASYNGIVLPASVPGTYTITSDCQITFSLTLPPPLSVATTFTGVLTNNLRDMTLVISSPPGTVIRGTHMKQDTRFCGAANFYGSYGISLHGGLVGTSAQAGLFQRTGKIVADGVGTFTATTKANYNGNAVEEDFTGTYNVSADCELTLTYTYGASATTYTIDGYLGGHGDSAAMMLLTNGWSVSGTFKAQQP
jgi:hypothetical protein